MTGGHLDSAWAAGMVGGVGLACEKLRTPGKGPCILPAIAGMDCGGTGEEGSFSGLDR